MEVRHTIILIADLNDGRHVPENLLVEPLGANRFRLLCSPGLVQGLAAGDEFETASEEPFGYRLLKRGRNVCLQLFVAASRAEELRTTLTPLAAELGGRLDGYLANRNHANLVFTVPVAAGFPAMERLMERARAIDENCEWNYGNVYDDKDGVTPLNWWRD